MARTHTVSAGETLGKISVHYYGSLDRWPEIVRANPQLSGRGSAVDGSPLIFPGDLLIIPEDSSTSSSGLGKSVVLDERAPQDMGLVGSGKKFTGFTGYTLVQAVKGVDGFSFSSVWDSTRSELRSAFRPFAYPVFDVYFDNDLVFKGHAMPPAPEIAPQSKEITVQGYPLCGVLLDSCLPPSLYPAEYSGLDLKQIAEKICEPFGVGLTVEGDVGAAFEKVDAQISDKAWDFLSKLAEQRGLFLTNKADGSLLIYRPEIEAVSASFAQGEVPFISCAASFDGQKMYSHVSGYTKTTKEANSQIFTYENKMLINKGILRCFAEAAGDAEEGTLEDTVRAKAGAMFASCVKYKLTVSGHRDKNGRLYRANMAVSVKAPGAMIYRDTKFLVDEVSMKRDDKTGATTEFTLVLPGSRDGSLPEVFPWEE